MPTTLELILSQLAAQNGGGPGLPPAAPSANIPLLPAPAAPITTGPPGPAPDLPPTPPMQPLDTGLANSYLQFAGPAPTPPAPLSRGQRIANALIGFGAGVQGYGPQFLQQLQEPQRRYEAQTEAYNARRSQLGFAGLEAAQRKQERRQEMTFRTAMAKADQEFELYKQRSGITDQLALRQLDQAHELAMQQRQQQFLTAQALQKEQADREKQAKLHERELIDKDFYPPPIAKSIARYTAGLDMELSPSAQQFQSVRAKKLQLQSNEIQAKIQRLNAGGGKAPANLVDIVAPDGSTLMSVPYRQLKLDRFGAPKGFPEGSKIRPSAQQQTQGAGALSPQQQNLYNTVKQQHPEASDAQIRQYMRTKGWLQ